MQGHLSLVSTALPPPTSTAALSLSLSLDIPGLALFNKILNPLPFIFSWTVIFFGCT